MNFGVRVSFRISGLGFVFLYFCFFGLFGFVCLFVFGIYPGVYLYDVLFLVFCVSPKMFPIRSRTKLQIAGVGCEDGVIGAMLGVNSG